ncbi:hypothetical protein Tco_0691511 [Tanacetum coccineum]
MEKFETPPDSPPIIIIDPDDQPMWSSTRNVSPTPSFSLIQLPISNNFRIKGTHMQMIWDNKFNGRIRSDPHRHIVYFLDISNLFQYGKNEEEAVMLRNFTFSLSGEAKTWKDLKEMRDGRRDNHASKIHMKDDTSMCEPHEANNVQGYHGRYHD